MMQKIVYVLRSPVRWMKRLYDWTLHWSKTSSAPYALFGIAFVESSFFPVPPDVLLIAMVVAHKEKWIRFAAICTAGSVCGAFLGYFIGWSLFETIGRFIVETYHLQAAMDLVGQKYTQNAFLTVFTAAFTPIPYKVITIAAGLFRIGLPVVVVASVLGRGARFFMVAAALRLYGDRIKDRIERYFDIFSILFIVLLIGGFVLLKYSVH